MESDQRKLFIGGISWQTDETLLRNYFSNFGEVLQVTVNRDKATGRHRGFGFVTFADPAVTDRVLQNKHHRIDNRDVDVNRAMSREEQNRAGRSGNFNASRNFDSGANVRTKKLFVGGLPTALTLEEFRCYFETYGPVNDAVIMIDQTTQRPRGFGFVSFDSEDSLNLVLHKTFHHLNGKQVNVQRAIPKDANPGVASGGGRGGGGAGGFQVYGGSGGSRYEGRVDSNRYMQPQNTYPPYGAGFVFGGYGNPAGAPYGNPGVPGAGFRSGPISSLGAQVGYGNAPLGDSGLGSAVMTQTYASAASGSQGFGYGGIESSHGGGESSHGGGGYADASDDQDTVGIPGGWDVENLRKPAMKAQDLLQNINKVINTYESKILLRSMIVVGNSNVIGETYCSFFGLEELQFTQTPDRRYCANCDDPNKRDPRFRAKEYSDVTLAHQILLKAYDNKDKPLNEKFVLLLSGDKDFKPVVEKLQHMGYNVMLGVRKNCNRKYLSTGNTACVWEFIGDGTGSFPKDRFQGRNLQISVNSLQETKDINTEFVDVYWDLNKALLPPEYEGSSIVTKIQNAMRNYFNKPVVLRSFLIVGTATPFLKKFLLENIDVEWESLPEKHPLCVDCSASSECSEFRMTVKTSKVKTMAPNMCLILRMHDRVYFHNAKNILLITGDEDFQKVIADFNNRGVNMFVAAPLGASGELLSAGKGGWLLGDMLAGKDCCYRQAQEEE